MLLLKTLLKSVLLPPAGPLLLAYELLGDPVRRHVP
jgi:hypothetical protein